jgi:hypothetical protein
LLLPGRKYPEWAPKGFDAKTGFYTFGSNFVLGCAPPEAVRFDV